MTASSALGDYLRARRRLVAPQTVGLPSGGARRVPGLRREEVALLAGISADYYLRLEQGRDRNPSLGVLESLARVLQLDETGAQHLAALAAGPPRRRATAPRERAPDGIRQLVGSLPLPAFVEGRSYDVLVANEAATRLLPTVLAGRNRLRDVFLDPVESAMYPDWDEVTATLVAGFRDANGAETDDPQIARLVGELSLASERFRQLWARHDVHRRRSGTARLVHPLVGELTLQREKLAISGVEGQMLAVMHAAPGSPDAEKLARLLGDRGVVQPVAAGGGPVLPRGSRAGVASS